MNNYLLKIRSPVQFPYFVRADVCTLTCLEALKHMASWNKISHWDERTSRDPSARNAEVWNWNPQRSLISNLLPHGFPVVKHQWEWKHPGLVNPSGQWRSPWESIVSSLVLGEEDWWETILFSIFVSFRTNHLLSSGSHSLCWLNLLLWGLSLQFLLHYWFLPKQSHLHSPYAPSAETLENFCAQALCQQ